MGNIHTILEAIIDNGTTGKKVQLGVVDKNEYETIRTRLVKLWVEQRTVIQAVGADSDPLADCALCADFSAATRQGTFYLGKPRRKLAKSYSFSIVDSSTDATSELAVPEPANDDSISTPKSAE